MSFYFAFVFRTFHGISPHSSVNFQKNIQLYISQHDCSLFVEPVENCRKIVSIYLASFLTKTLPWWQISWIVLFYTVFFYTVSKDLLLFDSWKYQCYRKLWWSKIMWPYKSAMQSWSGFYKYPSFCQENNLI